MGKKCEAGGKFACRLRYFFQFYKNVRAHACYFNSNKFFDSVRFIVRSYLSGCVRCTFTSGRNIAGKYIRSTGIRVTGKLQNTGNGVMSRIRLRWPFLRTRDSELHHLGETVRSLTRSTPRLRRHCHLRQTTTREDWTSGNFVQSLSL